MQVSTTCLVVVLLASFATVTVIAELDIHSETSGKLHIETSNGTAIDVEKTETVDLEPELLSTDAIINNETASGAETLESLDTESHVHVHVETNDGLTVDADVNKTSEIVVDTNAQEQTVLTPTASDYSVIPDEEYPSEPDTQEETIEVFVPPYAIRNEVPNGEGTNCNEAGECMDTSNTGLEVTLIMLIIVGIIVLIGFCGYAIYHSFFVKPKQDVGNSSSEQGPTQYDSEKQQFIVGSESHEEDMHVPITSIPEETSSEVVRDTQTSAEPPLSFKKSMERLRPLDKLPSEEQLGEAELTLTKSRKLQEAVHPVDLQNELDKESVVETILPGDEKFGL